MQRKIIKVGTSLAVLLPKAFLDEQKMKAGDTVEVEVSKKGTVLKKRTIDPRVIEWTEEFIKEYRPLLNKLAKS